MRPIMRILRVIVLLALVYTTECGADLIYKKVGGSVVLNPGQIFESIRSATWKHNTDLALVWFGSQTICSRDFEGRYLLDKKDGSMIIKNLNRQDSGSYTPEINDKVLNALKLEVIEPVPKPTVSVKCNNEETLCNLTCEANISAEFGPVTYRWRKDGKMVLSNDKELIITTENKESSFICELENIVSSSSSDGVDNPLSSGNHHIPAAVMIGFAVLIVVGGLVCYKQKHDKFPDLEACWGDAESAEKNNQDGDNKQTQQSLLGDTNKTAKPGEASSIDDKKKADQDKESAGESSNVKLGEQHLDSNPRRIQQPHEGTENTSETPSGPETSEQGSADQDQS